MALACASLSARRCQNSPPSASPRAVGDTWGEGNHLCASGSVEWYDGNNAASCAHCQQAVDRMRQYTDRWGLARALNRLGFALMALDQVPRAEVCFRESLDRGQLSGGQSQRVAIARVLAMNPKIIRIERSAVNLPIAQSMSQGGGVDADCGCT